MNMDFSVVSSTSSSSEDERDRNTRAAFREILDFHKKVDMEKVLRDWLDEDGDLIPYNDDELTRVQDESPEFYTSAFRAFNQGRNMPPRLQRSIHSLQATPPQMQKADIQLRPAQLEGAGLLCWLEDTHGLAILADDMGVGKTFQLMALMFQNQPSGAEKTTLLVVPAGAIAMWKANLERFTDISYVEYNTYNKDHLDVKDLAGCDIVLTTYNLVAKQYNNYAERVLDIKAAIQGETWRRVRADRDIMVKQQLDIQRPWAPLYGMAFHRVILDEAHRIRNVRSGQFKAMLNLKTRRRIACSGTIFNNDYTDVGAILTFLRYQPWCNPSSFARYFLKVKRKKAGSRGGGARRAQLKHLRGAVFKYTLDGISVRRNKRDKFEEQQIVGIEKLDYQKSEHVLDDNMGTFIIDHRPCTEQDAQKKTTELWSRQRSSQEDEDEDRDEEEPMDKDILGAILFARLACISNLCPHAGYSNRGLESEMQLDIELDRYDFYGDEGNIQRVKDASAFENARNRVRKAARTEWAKSTKLREALSHIKGHLEQNVDLMAPAKPHKIAVYCEYLSALDILEVGIQQEIPDQPILRIDGQSSSKSRNEAIKLFMQDPGHCIVLVTFNAGSEAIDLSSADYVLLLHPIWNPAQIQQCIGRAYRHGQKRQVKARVLVARSSIETYVYRIQDQKRKKDLLLKTPVNAKTMEQVGSIQGEVEFIEKVPYFVYPLLFHLLTMTQLTKIGVGKAQSRISAGASQATQDPDLDGNGTPRSGMQSEAEMMENAGQVPPDDSSSSDDDDSGVDSAMIETEVIEE